MLFGGAPDAIVPKTTRDSARHVSPIGGHRASFQPASRAERAAIPVVPADPSSEPGVARCVLLRPPPEEARAYVPLQNGRLGSAISDLHRLRSRIARRGN